LERERNRGSRKFFSRGPGVFLKGAGGGNRERQQGAGGGNVSLEKKSRTHHHTQNANIVRTAADSAPGYRG